MRYLCLIYEDEKWYEKASEADMKKEIGRAHV